MTGVSSWNVQNQMTKSDFLCTNLKAVTKKVKLKIRIESLKSLCYTCMVGWTTVKFRGIIQWQYSGLQNRPWGFESLFPCLVKRFRSFDLERFFTSHFKIILRKETDFFAVLFS